METTRKVSGSRMLKRCLMSQTICSGVPIGEIKTTICRDNIVRGIRLPIPSATANNGPKQQQSAVALTVAGSVVATTRAAKWATPTTRRYKANRATAGASQTLEAAPSLPRLISRVTYRLLILRCRRGGLAAWREGLVTRVRGLSVTMTEGEGKPHNPTSCRPSVPKLEILTVPAPPVKAKTSWWALTRVEDLRQVESTRERMAAVVATAMIYLTRK